MRSHVPVSIVAFCLAATGVAAAVSAEMPKAADAPGRWRHRREARGERRKDAALRPLSSVLAQCTACHATYRIEERPAD